MNSDDEARIGEIGRLFEAKGWRLRLDEVDEGWEAWFYLVGVEGSAAQAERGATRLEAAEAAWATYRRKPPLNVGDTP
jgi:hypothetical protein